jgi:hypothetical protein
MVDGKIEKDTFRMKREGKSKDCHVHAATGTRPLERLLASPWPGTALGTPHKLW